MVIFNLILILFLSFTLNIINNGFSIYFHADETAKLHIIASGATPFLHPMLMVQSVKIAKIFLSPYILQLIKISRLVSAFFGTGIVLLIFLLAKKSFKNNYLALITALGVAVSPILVMHSHYLKESIYFTFCEMLFLLQLMNYIRKQSLGNTLLLGIALGLCVSSEYIGCLSFLLLMIPLFSVPNINKKHFLKSLMLIFLLACGIFLLINYPILLDPHQFWSGLNFELHHSRNGHDVKIMAEDFYWSFHLIHSIVPGITPIVTILAILGIGFTIYHWKNESIENKVLCLYVLLFYFAEETSPLKPYPDFQRYMLCIAPVLIFFAVLTIHRIYLYFYNWRKNIIITTISILMVMLIVYPLYISIQLDRYLNHDTRKSAEKWMKHHPGNFLFTRYTNAYPRSSLERNQLLLGPITDIIQKAKNQNIRYFIVSSFEYQRFLDALAIPHQSTEVYQNGTQYHWLFDHFNFIEFKPSFCSFAFSNPTIRIIDLQSPKTIITK